MGERYYYHCIKCDKEYELNSKMGDKHYPQHVPIFGGVYTKSMILGGKGRAE